MFSIYLSLKIKGKHGKEDKICHVRAITPIKSCLTMMNNMSFVVISIVVSFIKIGWGKFK